MKTSAPVLVGRIKRFPPMIRILCASIAALTLTGPAMAGTTFTATLEQPVENIYKKVAANALWKCADTTCVATLERQSVGIKTCKKVAREVGKLSNFSSGDKSLSKSGLEKCNAEAKS